MNSRLSQERGFFGASSCFLTKPTRGVAVGFSSAPPLECMPPLPSTSPSIKPLPFCQTIASSNRDQL